MLRRLNGTTRHGQAVVLGQSMAGLCTARVLSDHFEHVLVIDRDVIPSEPANRRGVPQGRHAHALLVGGARRLSVWFPGIDDDLEAAGALRVDPGCDFSYFIGGGARKHFVYGEPRVVCSRALLEHTVRRHVAALSNVTLQTGAVEGLVLDADRNLITGVRVEDGAVISSELAVDATGRACRSEGWLAELGYEPPPTSAVKIDMSYTTRLFRRDPNDARGFRMALVFGDPPRVRGGAAFVLEHDRWMITLGGFHGDRAPTDLPGFREFARSMPSQVFTEIIDDCEPIGDAATHRLPTDLRRHVERMHHAPGGLVLVGDSVASFNPIYGQGMTSATMQAEALATEVARSTRLDERFAHRYHRRAAKAADAPWRMSTGRDFAMPQTTGPKPRGTDTIGKYMRKVVRASQQDVVVARRLTEVTNLARPFPSLFSPPIAMRVWRGERRARTDSAPRPVRQTVGAQAGLVDA